MTWTAAATHAERQEGEGTKYRIAGPDESGHWHIVEARTGRPTGKYGMSKTGAQEVLKRLVRRTNPNVGAKGKKIRKNPVPGITMEEWFADVQDSDWANWDLDRAGIMHYSGRGIPTYKSIVKTNPMDYFQIMAGHRGAILSGSQRDSVVYEGYDAKQAAYFAALAERMGRDVLPFVNGEPMDLRQFQNKYRY